MTGLGWLVLFAAFGLLLSSFFLIIVNVSTAVLLLTVVNGFGLVPFFFWVLFAVTIPLKLNPKRFTDIF